VLACAIEIKRGPLRGQLATGTVPGYRRHRNANEPPCEPCRDASREYSRAYRTANPEYHRTYYEANREKFVAAQRDYRRNHPESVQAYYEANRDRWRSYVRRRRALKRGVESDTYTTREIFERDRGRCQLCGKVVNPNLEWPHPQSLSLDHIIPLNDGGSDTRVNVQLSHLTCNLSKNTRTIASGEQLRLVG
jgi:5-methylcytosine-specific restriction endonuclease McrA